MNGFDVVKQQMQVKRSIGTIFSVGERGFFWRLTGYANLEFYAAINNVPRSGRKERIMEVLDLVGMRDKAFEVFQKYSGGMKRRVNIGVALLHKPQVIYMDEPTVGIDPQSRRNILDSVVTLKNQGMTVLYTTHYMEEAQELCNNIAITDHGQVMACGTHEELVRLVGQQTRIDLTLNVEAGRASS